MNSRAALELAPKAQFFEGQGIYGHFEIQSLGNAISMGLQEVFSTHQNTCKTGNNAIEMSQAFCDLARFERFTDLNLFKYAFNIIQTGKLMLYKFYSMVLIFCQQTVLVEGDESSQLSMANQPAVLAGYRPLLTALYRPFILYFFT